MDQQIRNAAFIWLEEQTTIHGDVLPWEILHKGFDFMGQRVVPIGASGIWKPKIMDLPLSITTSPNRTYPDRLSEDGFLEYKYRGNNVNHPDNVGLRELLKHQIPLIYFIGILKGKYLAKWPVFIVNDYKSELTFKVAIDDILCLDKPKANELEIQYRRSYITSLTLKRIHQQSFRERVLQAYQNQCSLCRLRHRELLDAAHIIGDREETGEPIVQNGLSLCKIHHAAFDQNIIGINPDYQIKVRKDILEETDGPMLKYGIQFLENEKLILPRNKSNWPDRNRLYLRYNEFIRAV